MEMRGFSDEIVWKVCSSEVGQVKRCQLFPETMLAHHRLTILVPRIQFFALFCMVCAPENVFLEEFGLIFLVILDINILFFIQFPEPSFNINHPASSYLLLLSEWS